MNTLTPPSTLERSAHDSAALLPGAALLSAPPAPVSLDEARGLLSQHYGLHGFELQALSGERDANFLVRPAQGPACMLKISHPQESALVADFQTQVLLHLARQAPNLPVQRLLPTQSGQPSLTLPWPEGGPRVVRLFSYLEGLPMPQAPRSEAQRLNVARLLARLDHALADFSHPAGEQALPWDIQRADLVRGLLVHVSDPARQALAHRALDGFVERVLPRLGALPRQAIHNDFNLYNLLVDAQHTDQVSGILDFGDLVMAPRVNELAVAASYQLDERGEGGAAGALAAIAGFAAAYHAEWPLQALELQLLTDLVRARLVMVVAISGWRAARQPDNAPYLLRNNAISWARLQALDSATPAQAEAALQQACR